MPHGQHDNRVSFDGIQHAVGAEKRVTNIASHRGRRISDLVSFRKMPECSQPFE